MRYLKPLAAVLALLTVALALACTSDDDGASAPAGTQSAGLVGDVLTVSRVGNGISGAFLAEGVFDVRVTGDNVTTENSRLIVFRITPVGNGHRTEIVTGSGPKALAEGVTQRPGPVLDMSFDLGSGEYYVLVKTDPANEWTITVTGVAGLPAG